MCGFAEHISGRNRRGNNLPRVLEKYVCLFADTFTYASIASANKQLLSVVMWDNELTSSWSNHFRMLVASRKDDY